MCGGVRDPAGQLSEAPADRARAAVEALWTRRRADILTRVDALADAVRAIGAAGSDTDAPREAAQQRAHQLAGTLASFGQFAAAKVARDLEQTLAAHTGDTPATHAITLTAALRRQLDRPPVATAGVDYYHDGAFLLLVHPDEQAMDPTVQAAAARGLRAEVVTDLGEAERLVAVREPDAVLLAAAGDWPGTLEFIRQLSRRTPAIPALVVAGTTAYRDRLDAVRAGARAIVPPSVSPSEVVELVDSILEQERRGSDNLLVVDDDTVFLERVEILLAAEGLRVTTLSDTRLFWQALEDTRPDMVLLDVTMPHTTGIELCRVLRADPRWAGLPVIVLTGRDGSAAAVEAFTVGADDYVVKSRIESELMTRITNRLARVHLYRELADKDPLTGLANRRKFSEEVHRLIRLADRQQQPLSFVMIDLDLFKQVNDRFGHATGDEVLRRLALILIDALRGEDVVGRWGGEEFALVLYGMSRPDAVHRVTTVLERFSGERFTGPDGDAFPVTFSAGVAQLPDDGKDGQTLFQAADRALFRAKSAGRNRVLAAGL